MANKIIRIINKSKNITLADRAEVADTPFKRLKGLLGRRALEQGEGLVIIPCNSIHTFFMRFSIDVAFIGKDDQVVAITHSLLPSRLFGAFLKGKLVIELPVGTLKKTNTTINDVILFENQ